MKKYFILPVFLLILSFNSFAYENYIGFSICFPIITQTEHWESDTKLTYPDTKEQGVVFAIEFEYMKIWNNNFALWGGLNAGGSNIEVSIDAFRGNKAEVYTLNGYGLIGLVGAGYRLLDFEYFQLVLSGVFGIDFYNHSGKNNSQITIDYLQMGLLAGLDAKSQFRISQTVLITIGITPLYKFLGYSKRDFVYKGISQTSNGIINPGSFTIIPKIGAFIQLD